MYCTSHSQRLDLLGLRKRTGAMREMYSLLHTTQPKVGSIRVKKKKRYQGCSERNVQLLPITRQRLDLLGLRKRTGAIAVLKGLYSVLHITQPKVGSIRVKEKNRCHHCTERAVQCTAHHTAKDWIY